MIKRFNSFGPGADEKLGYDVLRIGGIYKSKDGDIEVKDITINAIDEEPKVMVKFQLKWGNQLEAVEPYLDFILRLRGKKQKKGFFK